MEIYGAILSPFVARVIIAARHKGIKHKLVMPEGGTKTPAFLKINPMGKMPAMKDGAMTLFESAVMIDYIDAKWKKKRLVPAAAKAGAHARLIATIFAEYIQNGIFGLFGQRDPAKRDQAVVDAKLAEINKALDALEGLMTAGPYAAGKSLTVADCFAVPALLFLHALTPAFGIAHPLGERKKLNRYLAKARKDKVLGGVWGEMDASMRAWQASQQQAAS